jgi:branched-chain amino acid transport system substrate-binding protein
VQDSQSDSARAAQVAGDLIMNQKVDLIIAQASPNVDIPVSAQAEALGCPCILHFTVPEAHVADAPAEGLKWTFMQTWSSMCAVVAQEAAFALIPNNKKVAFAAPNNDDGMAWEMMAPPYFKGKGYEFIYNGLYQPGTEDFTADISAYKKAGCELLLHAGAVPPDFATLWQQCYQQAFQPVAATGGAAIMFPSSLGAISAIAQNLMVQGGWTPDLKFKESLTGMSASELAADFEAVMGAQWDMTITCLQPLEWAVDIFKRSTDIESKDETLKSILATKMETMLGPLDMTAAPNPANQTTAGRWHPNIVQPVGFAVQWQKGKGKWPFDQVIVASMVPDLVPTNGTMLPLTYS